MLDGWELKCGWCRKAFVVCRECDRNRRKYCSPTCFEAATAKGELLGFREGNRRSGRLQILSGALRRATSYCGIAMACLRPRSCGAEAAELVSVSQRLREELFGALYRVAK